MLVVLHGVWTVGNGEEQVETIPGEWNLLNPSTTSANSSFVHTCQWIMLWL